MVGTGHAAYTDRFHKLARLVPHLVTPENKRIESKNGSIKMNPEKRGNRGEPSKDRNGRDDNNRTRTEMLMPQPYLTLVPTIVLGEIMGPGRGINAWEPLPGLASKPKNSEDLDSEGDT
ncbi:hypothetical protein Tco_0849157 [Tanacetum coccineum]